MKLLRRNLSLMLAVRYLNPLRSMFSIITFICLGGVALGVMVLIVVLSVMEGLQREMENRLRELEHITARRDTVRDSIPVPYPVEVIKEVPAKLTWWQQTRLHLANILLYLLLIGGIIYVGKKHVKWLVGE